jgi:hypothetical protein
VPLLHTIVNCASGFRGQELDVSNLSKVKLTSSADSEYCHLENEERSEATTVPSDPENQLGVKCGRNASDIAYEMSTQGSKDRR